MIVKMMITFDYDPETNEYKPIKQEIIKEKAKVIKESEKVEESAEPQVTLEGNKYVLNKAAATLMGVEPEDRLDIQYKKIGKVMFPIIGSDSAFGTKGGNKLTKSLTVSCRGKAHERLSQYGDTFTVTKMKEQEGLFVLLGNADRPVEEEKIDNIDIKEDDNSAVDLPLDIELEGAQDNKIDPFSFTL